MKKEMLINVLQPEECRIAILENNVLEELYVERTSHESYVGNIYKGRIVNIEPSIQAAFVDFGVGRNGFLHVSDVEPAYYRHLTEPRRDEGRRGRRRSPPRDSFAGKGPASRPEAIPGMADFDLPDDDDDFTTLPENSLSGDQPEAGAIEGQAETSTPEERGRPRHRGRSHRGRGQAEAVPPEESPDAPGHSPAADEKSSGSTEPDFPPRPRLMDSAERRTDEDDPSLPPLEPRPPAGGLTDDDLSFSRPRPPSGEPVMEQPAEDPDDSFAEEEFEPEESLSPDDSLAQERDQLDDLEDDVFDDLEEELAPRRRGGGRDSDSDDLEEEELAPRRRRGGRDSGRDGGRDDRRRRGGRRNLPRSGLGRPKPLIQDIFRRGQEVLVQVIKEGIGTKGPTLSTYISIAGRYLVLMPGLNRIGVSRKITDEENRRRLREILNELQPPPGLGFIIRTAGLDRNKKELQRDLAYLSRLWQVVVRRVRKLKAPAEIYQESDMITRTIRDTFTAEIDTIWVDEKTAFEHAQEFLQIVMPRYANRIKLYDQPEPMFHKYSIEKEIARIQQRHVPLPNGGSIVIDQTEALVAIDVNSGNFRADNNAEETAYQMNLLAAREIARQLRLRDLGGVIVNDFIDMRDDKHRRGVERALRDAVKRDRARTKILKISPFGIIEMTRQRIRPSLKRSVYQDCPHCLGAGQVKTCESMSIDVMRLLQLMAHRDNILRVEVRVHPDVAHYLLNRKRQEIARLEESRQIQLIVHGVSGASPETQDFVCYDKNNNEVKALPFEEPPTSRRRLPIRAKA